MVVVASCPSCGKPVGPAGVGGTCRYCNQTYEAADCPIIDDAPAVAKAARAAWAAFWPGVPGIEAPRAVHLGFWLGLLALAAGMVACLAWMHPRGANACRAAGWLGAALGGGLVVLALVRDDCNFSFSFSGLSAALLSIALMTFWPVTPTNREASRGGTAADRSGGGNKGGGADQNKGGPPTRGRKGAAADGQGKRPS